MRKLGVVLAVAIALSAAPLFGAKRFVAAYYQNTDAVFTTIDNAGGAVVANYPELGVVIAESDKAGFAAAVKADPNFRFAVADQIVQWLPGLRVGSVENATVPGLLPQGAPQDAVWLARQWYLRTIQADLAWGVTLGSSAVKVAVLDTGICAHHIELQGKVDEAMSTSFVPAESDCPNCVGCPPWEDRHYHGTHVAGTISSNNLVTAGVAPNVRLRAVRVLNCAGSGAFSWIIQGIMFAANTGNQVINMSLSGYFPKSLPGAGELVSALNAAVNYAKGKGVLVVSAAGNNGLNLDKDVNYLFTPCQSGSGLCVGATTNADLLSSYSNHGLSGPQIVAPGGGAPYDNSDPYGSAIVGPCAPHSLPFPVCATGAYYLYASGTSMATPQVAGAAALVSSILGAAPGTANPAQLRNMLLQGADDLGKRGADNTYSQGRLNVYRAVTNK